MTALAAASCVADRLLKAKPFRHETPQGRLLQRLALVRFKVSTTVVFCVLDRVARNALARQTTLSTPVADEHSVETVVVVSVVVVVVVLSVLSLLFLQANAMVVIATTTATLQVILR